MAKGKIFTGEGKASEFLRKAPYREFLSSRLGKSVFPGTLNLKVDQKAVKKLKKVADHYRMDSTYYKGKELGGIDVYAIKIDDTEALIVDPDLTRYGDDVMEIVASEKLRDKLGLEDGDYVGIEPR